MRQIKLVNKIWYFINSLKRTIGERCKDKEKRIENFLLLYPIIFLFYPFLFLLSGNPDELYFTDILYPLIVGLIIVISIIIVLSYIITNPHKVRLLVFSLLIIFFSYGHLRGLITSLNDRHFINHVDWYLSGLFLFLFSIVLFITLMSKQRFVNITKTLNIFVLSLVFINVVFFINSDIKWSPGATIGDSGLKKYSKIKYKAPADIDEVYRNLIISNKQMRTNHYKNLPDIYYIILDAYAGQSTLKNLFKFDNSEFTNYLKDKGFFVASKARSNYAHTLLSLSSSLNMKYINVSISEMTEKSKKVRRLQHMIHNNAVMRFLSERGYTTINISTCHTYTSNNPYADIDMSANDINDFLVILAKTTLIAPFAEKLGYFRKLRQRILNAFSTLASIPRIEKPTFTLAHILPPHPPYLFKRDGMPLRKSEIETNSFPWNNREGYIDQLIYINTLVEDAVDKIINRSDTKPIIIIQSDHGPASLLLDKERKSGNKTTLDMINERFDILYTFFLPGNESSKVEKLWGNNTGEYIQAYL